MNLEEFTHRELEKIKKPAMQITFSHPVKNAGADAESHLGGKPYVLKDEIWPTCPSCKTDMEFFLQIRELEPDKNISLKTFYKCDCEIENYRPIISIREFANPAESFIDHTRYEGRNFEDYLAIRMEPIWSAPGWRVLPSYNKPLYDKILSSFPGDEDAEDFYEDQRLFHQMIAENPFTVMYGYPEFYSDDKDSVKCGSCGEYTSFYFQIDSLHQNSIDWNKGTLYCYVCPNPECPKSGTYYFIIN